MTKKTVITGITPVGTLGYCDLFVPRSVSKSEPEKKKYFATIIFHKDTDLSALKADIEKTAKDKFGKDLPRNLRSPIRYIDKDGWIEGSDKQEKPRPKLYWDKYMVTFSSKFEPLRILRDKTELTAEEELPNASKAAVIYSTFAYDNEGKGVSLNLEKVVKLADPTSADSEALGGNGAVSEKETDDYLSTLGDVEGSNKVNKTKAKVVDSTVNDLI